MSTVSKKKLGEILVEDGLITKDQLQEALNVQSKTKERKYLGELLIEMGYLSEEGLCLSISKKLGIKFISYADKSFVVNFDHGLEKLIDKNFAAEHFVLPLAKTGHYLTVAMFDPLNFVVVDNVKRLTKLDLIITCATRKDIIAGIENLYVLKGAAPLDALRTDGPIGLNKPLEGEASQDVDKLKVQASEAPVVKIVNRLVQQAIKEKASDIHIDPQDETISIRMRIDGVLYEVEPPPKDLIMPIISRIKILSRLDIAEKRLPQDGAFMMKIDDRNVDFRVSSIPTIYGEKIAIRILDKESMNIDLRAIGVSQADLDKIMTNAKKPYGLIFITGPTGSGKSTSLYCILSAIKSTKKNILTIEDPVEYRMKGVNQVQAQPSIGLDFAKGLRTFLRQDPDIIMVGEVRDLETAEICVRSALVGRLVLSTLHTNDSVGSISRLVDFGIERFLLSSTLNMVIAQRLARKLCQKCKVPVALDKKIQDEYKLEGATVYGPKGCQACNGRGYAGRVGLFEIMVVDDEIKEMIERGAELGAIKDKLIKKGMKTLRDDGLDKVRAGLTSLDEVMTVTMEVK